MNDFTKEELDYMLDSIYFNELEHHLEKDIPDYAIKLINKIQSMIDNYDAQVIEAWQCEKCGHVQ